MNLTYYFAPRPVSRRQARAAANGHRSAPLPPLPTPVPGLSHNWSSLQRIEDRSPAEQAELDRLVADALAFVRGLRSR